MGGASLRSAHLIGAKLIYTDLGGANLNGAHLKDAYLMGSNMEDANFMGADLAGADFKGSNLFLAYFFTFCRNIASANFEDAFMDDKLRRYIIAKGGKV